MDPWLDKGEASERQDSKEIRPDLASVTFAHAQAFSEQLLTSKLIHQPDYQEFIAPINSILPQPVSNEERKKLISNLQKEKERADLSADEREDAAEKLSALVIEQAYSDYLFMRRHIADLSKMLYDADQKATEIDEKIEYLNQVKDVVLSISSVITRFDAYMESTPELITNTLEAEVDYGEFLKEINHSLYVQIGLQVEDLSNNPDNQTDVLLIQAKRLLESHHNPDEVTALIDMIDETIRKVSEIEAQQNLQKQQLHEEQNDGDDSSQQEADQAVQEVTDQVQESLGLEENDLDSEDSTESGYNNQKFD